MNIGRSDLPVSARKIGRYALQYHGPSRTICPFCCRLITFADTTTTVLSIHNDNRDRRVEIARRLIVHTTLPANHFELVQCFFEYRKGSANGYTDFFSRLPQPAPENDRSGSSRLTPVDDEANKNLNILVRLSHMHTLTSADISRL